MELTPTEFNTVMNRFPEFELSYETIPHKKVSTAYNICLAIPHGKKCYVWYTYLGGEDICLILDVSRDKRIIKATRLSIEFPQKLAFGTILYGTLVEEPTKRPIFVAEDMFYYKGVALTYFDFNETLKLLSEFMKESDNTSLFFACPLLWEIKQTTDFECPTHIPEIVSNNMGYQVHHIQYRCLFDTKPYLNVFLNRKLNLSTSKPELVQPNVTSTIPTMDFDYSKPQYRYPTVFQVTADIQFDVYHLFVYGKNNTPVYYNLAGIPNYRTSVFMNGLFRNIKENQNLDYIEESDDEDDFQNMNEDKYVDIQKTIHMECVFNMKFKKWIPLRVVDKSCKIVHVSKLIREPDEVYRNHYNNQQLQNRPYNNNNQNQQARPYSNYNNNQQPYNNQPLRQYNNNRRPQQPYQKI
jgi:hypothetical protein